jgi:hypothetical protein
MGYCLSLIKISFKLCGFAPLRSFFLDAEAQSRRGIKNAGWKGQY